MAKLKTYIPCYKLYRVENVSLPLSKFTFKLMSFVSIQIFEATS